MWKKSCLLGRRRQLTPTLAPHAGERRDGLSLVPLDAVGREVENDLIFGTASFVDAGIGVREPVREVGVIEHAVEPSPVESIRKAQPLRVKS